MNTSTEYNNGERTTLPPSVEVLTDHQERRTIVDVPLSLLEAREELRDMREQYRLDDGDDKQQLELEGEE